MQIVEEKRQYITQVPQMSGVVEGYAAKGVAQYISGAEAEGLRLGMQRDQYELASKQALSDMLYSAMRLTAAAVGAYADYSGTRDAAINEGFVGKYAENGQMMPGQEYDPSRVLANKSLTGGEDIAGNIELGEIDFDEEIFTKTSEIGKVREKIIQDYQGWLNATDLSDEENIKKQKSLERKIANLDEALANSEGLSGKD
jgi:hypothetical protein